MVKKMGQGREAAQNLLERPELLKSIEDKLRHKKLAGRKSSFFL